MYEKLCDNLNRLMNERNLNASELARRIGLPASTIKKIRNRDNPNPTLATLVPIANYFSITLSELIGEDKSYSANTKSNEIPILSWDQTTWTSTAIQKSTNKIFIEDITDTADYYCLTIEDHDHDHLKHGTVLIVDSKLTPEHKDFVIIHKLGQKTASIKQIIFDEDLIYLKPIYQGYNAILKTKEHKILGVVIEYRKQLKIKK